MPRAPLRSAITPAEHLGLNKGRIEVGYDADFIAVDSTDKLLLTVIGGEKY